MSILTVQRKLQAAGFAPGPIDGLWGRRTEAALDAALAAARQRTGLSDFGDTWKQCPSRKPIPLGT